MCETCGAILATESHRPGCPMSPDGLPGQRFINDAAMSDGERQTVTGGAASGASPRPVPDSQVMGPAPSRRCSVCGAFSMVLVRYNGCNFTTLCLECDL